MHRAALLLQHAVAGIAGATRCKSALIVVAALACGAGCSSAPRPQPAVVAANGGTPQGRAGPRRPDVVILLSLDGFRHDYPARVPTPTFDRLARQGGRAMHLVPPFPSQTLPSHATLATGVRPGRHGILNNHFYDRKRGAFHKSNAVTWYEVAPLWIVAQRSGLRTHVYHWIGVAGAYHGVEPAWWREYTPGVTDAMKIDAIIDWLGLPADRRPRLAMSYLLGCDRTGHIYGPSSAQIERCISKADRLLGRLVHAIEAHPKLKVTLLVVSDHGMTRSLGDVNPALALQRAGLEARVLAAGPVANVYAEPDKLEPIAKVLGRLPHVRVYRRSELPAELGYQHPQRTGDLVLVAQYGYRFRTRIEQIVGPPTVRGHHGHDPGRPEMWGILVAWGAGIRRGARLRSARALDVAPTVYRLLGLPIPAYVEGVVLEQLLDKNKPAPVAINR